MDDKEFYAECVRRISTPLKTKTDIQMVRIVLQNTKFDVADMFDDKAVNELFNKFRVSLAGEAYKFIRDNQDLYVNPEYMNYEQISAILNDVNVMNILKSKTFSPKDSQQLLDNAIYVKKTEVIKHFIEKGVMPSTNTAIFLEHLVREPKCMSSVRLLQSNGVDLINIASGKLLIAATLGKNNKAVELLMESAPYDMYAIKKSLSSYVAQEYHAKVANRLDREVLLETTRSMIPIVQMLVEKLSPKSFDTILDAVKSEEMKVFLREQYLRVELQNNLPLKEKSSLRAKI